MMYKYVQNNHNNLSIILHNLGTQYETLFFSPLPTDNYPKNAPCKEKFGMDLWLWNETVIKSFQTVNKPMNK